MDSNGLEKHRKHEENPYLENVLGYIKSKSVKNAYIKKSSDDILIDKDTGEQIPHYNAIYIKTSVDVQQYNKIYVESIGKLFDLSKTAQKVIKYVYSKLEKDTDTVFFNLQECKEFCGYRSNQPVYTGIAELIEQNIIARTQTHYKYYINPTVMFNGDRLVIIKEYKKRKQLP